MPIGVPAGKEQLSGAEVNSLFGPGNGINPCLLSSPVGADLPFGLFGSYYSLGINSNYDALRAESLCSLADKLGIKETVVLIK